MDWFDAVSPLDYRYYGRNTRAFEALKPFVSENSRIRYFGRVELELVKALIAEGIAPKKAAEETGKAVEMLTAEAVYAEEDRIRHDIRALANCIRKNVSDETKPFIHLAATSYDIVDTGNALRYKEGIQKAVLPQLIELEKTLIGIALREKATIQIGRTHGQHAEPITFGFALSNYVSRLGKRIKTIEQCAENLTGKFSGAVGAYNATSLLVKDPIGFEKRILDGLGLKASHSSTQIIEPEPLVDLGHALVSCLGVLADLADDCRHLQRSEIGELREEFRNEQVGSSTMPHKRNPINFENVKSFWKQFMPRMISLYMDQLSEHQRDLTNSASQRFFSELLVALFLNAERLNRTMQKTVVDRNNLQRNFSTGKNAVVAEPLYILLALHGHPNAHETVKQLTLRAESENRNIFELAEQQPELQSFVQKLSLQQKTVLQNPEQYIGKAIEKTESICNQWKKEFES
jgi:adenylosuccinate lyase